MFLEIRDVSLASRIQDKLAHLAVHHLCDHRRQSLLHHVSLSVLHFGLDPLSGRAGGKAPNRVIRYPSVICFLASDVVHGILHCVCCYARR